ncbi:MAG: hypothetical protein DYH17_07385 [Xanthomonadales bacterium PRO6]|nr:hypothetical protein [Xanthomonadales bacterium PRO6]
MSVATVAPESLAMLNDSARSPGAQAATNPTRNTKTANANTTRRMERRIIDNSGGRQLSIAEV